MTRTGTSSAYAILTLAALLLATPASASCLDDWLVFDADGADGKVDFLVSNSSDFPLTVTMKFSLRRMEASRRTTFTESLAPGESRSVITLERTDSEREGRYKYKYECTIGHQHADHDDDIVYLLPYEAGKSYRVLQGYGSRFSHTGIEEYTVDFDMQEGTPVHAARSGRVARTEERHNKGCWSRGCGDYANYIVIVHDDDTTGEYYHLLQDGVLVEEGDFVEAGQLIGLSGNTGHTTMPHLHFGVYRAIDWGREQSIPVRFISADGIVDRPRRGGRYPAVSEERLSRFDDEISGQPEQQLN